MLQDLDATLAALLQAELSVQNVAISFAAPDDQFPPSGVSLPAIDFFLYDVREDHDLRSTQWELERQCQRDDHPQAAAGPRHLLLPDHRLAQRECSLTRRRTSTGCWAR